MTPKKWYNGSSNKWGGVFNIDDYGMLYDSYDVSWTGFGLRPVINLRSDVTFSVGDGTLDNPYIVAD